MQAQFPDSIARVETQSTIFDLTSCEYPNPTYAVFEEPLHTVALQQTPRHSLSVGRYCLPKSHASFRDIGRLLLLPASVPLEVHSSGGPNEVVRCQFTPEMLSSYGADPDLCDSRFLLGCLNVRHSRIADIMARLGQELRSPGLASTAMIEALGATLIIEFVRFICEQPKQAPQYRGGLSRRQFRTITEYIENHEKCPSLSDLSELTGLSLRHLTRAFKQTTGETVYGYIEQVRFHKAQAMLADTNILMKDIAYRLGFSCSSSFSVAFRKIAGETPKDYRHRNKSRRQFPTHDEVIH